MSRTQKLYLNDIHDSAKAIFEYTAGLSFEEFSKDRKTGFTPFSRHTEKLNV